MQEIGKLERLVRRPDVILGDPDELVSLSWEQEIDLDCGEYVAMLGTEIDWGFRLLNPPILGDFETHK